MNTLCETQVGIIVNSVPECDHGTPMLKDCEKCTQEYQEKAA